MIVLTIHDAGADIFLRPFFARAHGEATRMFIDLVNDPEHPIGQHPGDYTLYVCGEFSELTGVLAPTELRSLGNGVTFSKQAPPSVVREASSA